MISGISRKLVSSLRAKLEGICVENVGLGKDVDLLKKSLTIYDNENRRLEVQSLKKDGLIHTLLER